MDQARQLLNYVALYAAEQTAHLADQLRAVHQSAYPKQCIPTIFWQAIDQSVPVDYLSGYFAFLATFDRAYEIEPDFGADAVGELARLTAEQRERLFQGYRQVINQAYIPKGIWRELPSWTQGAGAVARLNTILSVPPAVQATLIALGTELASGQGIAVLDAGLRLVDGMSDPAMFIQTLNQLNIRGNGPLLEAIWRYLALDQNQRTASGEFLKQLCGIWQRCSRLAKSDHYFHMLVGINALLGLVDPQLRAESSKKILGIIQNSPWVGGKTGSNRQLDAMRRVLFEDPSPRLFS